MNERDIIPKIYELQKRFPYDTDNLTNICFFCLNVFKYEGITIYLESLTPLIKRIITDIEFKGTQNYDILEEQLGMLGILSKKGVDEEGLLPILRAIFFETNFLTISINLR